MPNSSVFPGGVSEKEDEVKYWQEHFDKFGLHRKQLKEMLVPSLESSHTIFGNKKQFLKDDDQILERSVENGFYFDQILYKGKEQQ